MLTAWLRGGDGWWKAQHSKKEIVPKESDSHLLAFESEISSKQAQVSESGNNLFALSEMYAISNDWELMFSKLL